MKCHFFLMYFCVFLVLLLFLIKFKVIASKKTLTQATNKGFSALVHLHLIVINTFSIFKIVSTLLSFYSKIIVLFIIFYLNL